MIYPTVTILRKTHGIKDECSCICGLNYRENKPRNSKDLYKPIHFRKVNSINCKECRSILLKEVMSQSKD